MLETGIQVTTYDGGVFSRHSILYKGVTVHFKSLFKAVVQFKKKNFC